MGHIIMKDIRHNKNPSKENLKYYRLFSVDYRTESWNKPADFWIVARSYKPDITTFSTKRLDDRSQIGVVISDRSIVSVFERMDMSGYLSKDLISYSLSKANIHRCFNEQLNTIIIT